MKQTDNHQESTLRKRQTQTERVWEIGRSFRVAPDGELIATSHLVYPDRVASAETDAPQQGQLPRPQSILRQGKDARRMIGISAAELVKQLEKVAATEPEALVFLATDEEGNGFKPVSTLSFENPDFSEEFDFHDFGTAIGKVVILWPRG